MEKSSAAIQEIFGRNLRERRKKLGFTQGEFADRLGVSTSFITEMEKGRKAPSFATIERISSLTGAPVWTFFCEGGYEIEDASMMQFDAIRYRLKKAVCQSIDKTLNGE